ncbi:Synaptobrevin [Teladorsagia circumcincta]|uniref:Synaptobrevin n=1 Tax=Teladorsagia circumcincta TaxID=45464 RepID=A0A2G9U336_TELCI|nr:Synaptobrevin [Teladorsagia circumcincta]
MAVPSKSCLLQFISNWNYAKAFPYGNIADMADNSQKPSQDEKIQEMRRQVDEVKTVMASNVASIMERGERLDSIERRTDELQASSANFKLTAHRVQRKMCMMNAKWTIISVLVALFVTAVIILLILDACGVFNKK